MRVLTGDHDKPIASVELSPCGRWLAAQRYTVAVDVWDLSAGRVAFTHEGRSGTWGAAFAVTTGWLLVWGKAGLTCYRPPDFSPTRLVSEPLEDVVVADRRVVAMCDRSDGDELVCWRTTEGGLRPVWATPPGTRPGHLATDSTGCWLAVANGWVELRAMVDGRSMWEASGLMHSNLLGVLDDRRVVLGDHRALYVYDGAAGRTVATLGLPGSGPVRAAVSPSGHSLVACTRADVFVLSVEPLAVRQRYAFRTRGKLTCVAFAPDGLTAACGTSKGEVVIWDVG